MKSGLTLKTGFLTPGGLAKLREELVSELDPEVWVRMGPETGGQEKADRRTSAAKALR